MALANLEVLLPCYGAARDTTPLFVVDSSFTPMTHYHLDRILPQLLMAVGVDAEEVGNYSWHSFRAYLASALHAVDASVPAIQALVRWRSTESVAIYAAWEPHDYMAYLLKASRVRRLKGFRSQPILSADEVVASLRSVSSQPDHPEELEWSPAE